MNFTISKNHPLHQYHRNRPNHSGRTDAQIISQWGELRVVEGIPDNGFAAGSYQRIKFKFTCGSMGLDESGSLCLNFRTICDIGRLQWTNAEEQGYVTVQTDGNAKLRLSNQGGVNRPFHKGLWINITDASLNEGETITLVLGDRSGGGPGWRQQTFQELPFPVRISVDPFGTGLFQYLPYDIGWNVLPGELDHYIICVPSHGQRGEPFSIKVKGMDRWGNPLRNIDQKEPGIICKNGESGFPLEKSGTHEKGIWTYSAELSQSGIYRFEIQGARSYSNCIILKEKTEELPLLRHNWCDLHGQTGETVGAGTVEDYFEFGRHFGFLDGITPQGNDLQLTPESWALIKKATEDAYSPGEYVTFPGYEWSGTTTMGGDYNVIYFEEDPPLYRSTGWLAGNPFEEVSPLPKLYEKLRNHRAIAMAHIGGRPASLEHWDPEVAPLVEIHSAWGTFEWVYKKCFEKGFKIGFACNSDDHKTRPGASYPGAGVFGTLGGLTCILSAEKTREGFWKAMVNRNCYGTTGQRIIVETNLNGKIIGEDVQADKGHFTIKAVGTTPIIRLDLMRKAEILKSFFPNTKKSRQKVMIRFGGARVYGRARNVAWSGKIKVAGNTIKKADFHGTFNPDHGITAQSESEAEFICSTSGNSMNLILDLNEGLVGEISFESNVCGFKIDVSELTRDPKTFFQSEVDRFAEAFLISADNLSNELSAEFTFDFKGNQDTPYFIRVLQLDEGKAWTSPWYVTEK